MSKVPARTEGELATRAEKSAAVRDVLLPAQRVIHSLAASGLVLLVAAVVALIWANSGWGEHYFRFWDTPASVQAGTFTLKMTLRHWVNDGLMALFFFSIAVEVKREFLDGHLSRGSNAAFPVAAALGGMVAPAVLFLAVSAGGPGERGWAVPMATDVAFALAVLSMLGDRVPAALRAVLLAFATVDDVGSIIVIAVYYTEAVAWPALGAAALLVGLLAVILRAKIVGLSLYLLIGALVWLAVHESGVHATIAGVVLGLLVPIRAWSDRGAYAGNIEGCLREYRQAEADGNVERADALLGRIEELTVGTESSVDRWDRLVRPWVSYLVLPAFALANAGVAISAGGLRAAAGDAVAWGVVLGLLVGKPVGILAAVWAADATGLARRPADLTWGLLAGLGLLGGIGFTVSLFISELAFDGPRTEVAKIAILATSVLAGCVGYGVLRVASRDNDDRTKAV